MIRMTTRSLMLAVGAFCLLMISTSTCAAADIAALPLAPTRLPATLTNLVPTIVAVALVPAEPQQPATGNEKSRRSRRTYEVAVSREGMDKRILGMLEDALQCPARFVDTQGNDGYWRNYENTVAAIHKNGDSFLVDFLLNGHPSKHSVLVLGLKDQGGKRGILPIGGVDCATVLTQSAGQSAAWKSFGDSEYKILQKRFPKRPRVVVRIARLAIPPIVRSGLGFAVGGPIGAAIGPTTLVADFALAKVRGNQQRVELEMAEPPVAVQFTIASQAAQIEELAKRVSEQQRLITSLQVALAAMQAQRQEVTTAKSERAEKAKEAVQ